MPYSTDSCSEYGLLLVQPTKTPSAAGQSPGVLDDLKKEQHSEPKTGKKRSTSFLHHDTADHVCILLMMCSWATRYGFGKTFQKLVTASACIWQSADGLPEVCHTMALLTSCLAIRLNTISGQRHCFFPKLQGWLFWHNCWFQSELVDS